MIHRHKVVIGERFGRLVILKEVELKGHRRRVLCRCDCGAEKIIKLTDIKRGDSGAIKSCGCLRKENASRKTHGYTGTRIYSIWKAIIKRCSKPSCELDKNNYLDRGIKVCDRWKKFENFIEDMGIPSDELQIDRIDNNGNYEPGNCRWATRKVNARNRRSSVFLSFNGESKTIAEWAEQIGVNRYTLHYRHRSGWPDDRILTEPPRINRCSVNFGTW